MDRGRWGLRLFLGGGGLGFPGLTLAAVLDAAPFFVAQVAEGSPTWQAILAPALADAVLVVVLLSFLASVSGIVLTVGAPEPPPASASAAAKPGPAPRRRERGAGQGT